MLLHLQHCGGNIAAAHERSCRPRRPLKINGLRQPRYQSLPVCFDGIIRLHLPEESHLDSTSLPLKLAPMGCCPSGPGYFGPPEKDTHNDIPPCR